eukprot:Colp12_sorted_trinity150504_noHs@26050
MGSQHTHTHTHELAGAMLGVAVGSAIPSVHFGQTVIPPVLFPLQLFSGYLIRPEQIPVYFKWLYYLSFYQYGFQITSVNEFETLVFEPCTDSADSGRCPFGPKGTGKSVLGFLDYDPADTPRNVYILLGYLGFLILAGYFVLKYQARKRRD